MTDPLTAHDWAALQEAAAMLTAPPPGLREETLLCLTGPEQPLVRHLVAAALYTTSGRLGLRGKAMASVPLALADSTSVAGTLRRAPTAALRTAPACPEGDDLLAAAAGDPDQQLLWRDVQQAAVDTVVGHAAHTPLRWSDRRHPDTPAQDPTAGPWRRGCVLGDVVLHTHATAERARILDSLRHVFGDAD